MAISGSDLSFTSSNGVFGLASVLTGLALDVSRSCGILLIMTVAASATVVTLECLMESADLDLAGTGFRVMSLAAGSLSNSWCYVHKPDR
jgi:hypothetical protein